MIYILIGLFIAYGVGFITSSLFSAGKIRKLEQRIHLMRHGG
jgi:hypothetical protein